MASLAHRVGPALPQRVVMRNDDGATKTAITHHARLRVQRPGT